MQLQNYISDLLYQYECVVVPEFGAFLAQPSSAKLNKDASTFFPPKKMLVFNEQLKTNDGLLANYITATENVPYHVAVKKIALQVTFFKSCLAQGDTLVFNAIGALKLTSEGKLQFTPSNELNYFKNAFGLSKFVSPNITREVLKTEVEHIEAAVPIAITTEKRKSRPFLKYAAFALVFLALGGLIGSNYYVYQIESNNQIAQEEANKVIADRVQQATFVIANPLPEAILNVTKQSGNFHLVAGAFRVEANSDKKLKQLQKIGFNARKIGKNKYGLHQVVYSSYDTRGEAQRELYKIRRSINKSAWLLVKNLN